MQPEQLVACGKHGGILRKQKERKMECRSALPVQIPRFPSTNDEKAKGACLELARTIAGKTPPAWFVSYLEESIYLLAAHRYVAPLRRKAFLKSKFLKLLNTIDNLIIELNDPIVISLLGESVYRSEEQIIQHCVKELFESGGFLQDYICVGKTFYEEYRRILQSSALVRYYVDYTLNTAELSGTGRNHAYFRGNVPSRQYCAIIIAVSRKRFNVEPFFGREARMCAQRFWAGSHTALGSGFTLKENERTVSDELGLWRTYFSSQKRTVHFQTFESCRVRLSEAAFLATKGWR